MKKILLTILTIILILSVNVIAVDIDIGMPAINRGNYGDVNTTRVNIGNPANASGTINKVNIWSNLDLYGCEVAIFYVVSGNDLSTRDVAEIGFVAGDILQTFDVDLDVVTGDFIGMVFTGGQIERDTSGFDGIWSLAGDWIPCTDETFTVLAGDAISLYGYSAIGWDHKWNTQTISKWNTKEFTKWNGLE